MTCKNCNCKSCPDDCDCTACSSVECACNRKDDDDDDDQDSCYEDFGYRSIEDLDMMKIKLN